MSFGAPDRLLLFLAVLGMAAMTVWLEAWRRRARRAFSGPRTAPGQGLGASYSTILLVAAAVLLVLAAALPQWGQREFSRERQGVDLVIALDVSQSMTARDVQPTRLGVAQENIGNLILSLRGNRIGLVLFAGTAIERSPLSTDVQALDQIVRRADREPGLTRTGSDLGGALDQAKKILDASESKSRAVILVSDGEDFGGTFADRTRELNALGIVVYTAGVGTAQGSTLIEPVGATGQTRVKIDTRSGQPVISRLDEGNLRAAAQAGGGRYLRLTASGRDLLALRDDLSQLQQSPLGAETQKAPVERFQWFAGAAALLLAVAFLAPSNLALPRVRAIRWLRARPGPAVIAFALFLGAACGRSDSVQNRNDIANRLYVAARYEEALKAYEDLLAARPDLPELAYNAGNTLNRLGSYNRAIEETRRALPPANTKLGAATYYALGNHFLALNRLEDAFDAYRSALLLDSSDADAKYNLEVVLRRMNQPPAPGQGQPAPGGPPGDPPPEGGEQPGRAQAPNEGPPAPPEQGPQQPSDQPAPLRQLEEALAGLNDEISFEEALKILDLVQRIKQQQQPQQRPAGPSSGAAPDY